MYSRNDNHYNLKCYNIVIIIDMIAIRNNLRLISDNEV